MAGTRQADIIAPRVSRELDDAIASVSDSRRTVEAVTKALDGVAVSPRVRKAIEGVRHDREGAFGEPVNGPLNMLFLRGDEEFIVTAATGGGGRVQLSSGRDQTPQDHAVIAEELFRRGYGPADVEEAITSEVRIRAAKIREFAGWLKHGDE